MNIYKSYSSLFKELKIRKKSKLHTSYQQKYQTFSFVGSKLSYKDTMIELKIEIVTCVFAGITKEAIIEYE